MSERCPAFHFQYRCVRDAGHAMPHQILGDDGTRYVVADPVEGEDVANRTWRRGFLHLTVDSEGLASLWDHALTGASYLRLELTAEQVQLIEATRRKGGSTP